MIADNAEITPNQPLVVAAAFVVGVLAVTRVVRLIVDDDYPPMVWLRRKYTARVSEDWVPLVECPWCVAPYVALGDVLWAWGSGLAWHWWVGNVWAAVAWLAAFLNVRDLPPDQR